MAILWGIRQNDLVRDSGGGNIGVVKVVDSMVASGKRLGNASRDASTRAKRRFCSILAESSRIAGATLEEHRTPEAASPPLASPASASFCLHSPYINGRYGSSNCIKTESSFGIHNRSDC